MNKKLTSAIAIMILLSGCSTLDSKLEQILINKSGILNSENYLLYQQYKESGLLNEKGEYYDPSFIMGESDIKDNNEGKIHVTFANNKYLNILYYSDASMNNLINSSSYYYNPGDYIYAKLIDSFNPNSNLYRLSKFKIVEYDSNGVVKEELEQQANDGLLAYRIPDDFSGTEIAIIPIGEYPKRNLTMQVYYVDDKGNKRNLTNAGSWSINNNLIDEDEIQISPIESYILKYEYDVENYFYVKSEPSCFTKDPLSSGFVEFWEANSTDDNLNYAIELRKYLSVSLKFKKDAKVRVNDGTFEKVKKDKELNIEKLKYGDKITIETTGDIIITNGNYQHIQASKDEIGNGNRYTLKVVEKSEGNTADKLIQVVDVKRTFKVKIDENCKFGTCSFTLDGKRVSGETSIKEGQKLTLKYNLTNKKYKFAEKSKGFFGFINDIFNGNERTITIPVTEEDDESTFVGDDWLKIVKKGE